MNINFWESLAPIMLAGAFLLGWLVTGLKGCKLQLRPIAIVIVMVYGVAATCVFSFLLFAESYLGFVQLWLDHFLSPGDSEAWADFLAIGGIITCGLVYAGLLTIAALTGDSLKRHYLEQVGTPRRRAYCRTVSCDDARASCPYLRNGECPPDDTCPCGVELGQRIFLTKYGVEHLMAGLAPLFQKQAMAGCLQQCTIVVPVVDNDVILTADRISTLYTQALQLEENLYDLHQTVYDLDEQEIDLRAQAMALDPEARAEQAESLKANLAEIARRRTVAARSAHDIVRQPRLTIARSGSDRFKDSWQKLCRCTRASFRASRGKRSA